MKTSNFRPYPTATGGALSAPKTIDNRFVIKDPQRDLLGRGGMGAVFLGRDQLTDKLVAIKALNPDLTTGNPDTVARFQREAKALRQLDHPNIVSMIAEVEENGRYFLIVEYVSGGNLRQLLNRKKTLSIRRVLQLGLELADALSRTHHLRIIHRDLKPANVLLTESGVPKLTDFGVASIADSNYLTQTGTWVGTPHYLSPEACNGEKLDARADIWAFGILLYELLAGKVPFGGESLMTTLTAIFRHPLPDLIQARPDVPEGLLYLIQHMLVKERERRIGSMRLVATELEALLQGKPSPARLGPLQAHEQVHLTQLQAAEFETMVTHALKRYREGNWLGLADSPLARSVLVEPYFLPGEPVAGDSRAQALQVMLRWGIEKLNPGGRQSWLDSSWRHYNILYSFYVEGRRVDDLAELMAITPQTFYSGWRPQAITAVSHLLQDEIATDREKADRQRFALTDRYQRRPRPERIVLRALAIFNRDEFVPIDWLYRLVPDEVNIPETLRLLVEAHLVQRDEQLTAVRLHPQLHPHVAPFLSLSEQSRWYHALGIIAQQTQKYLEAARHFRRAGANARAAAVLIQHRQELFDRLQVEGLRALLEQFQEAELADNPNLWAQLQIASGKVAEYLEDNETAVAAYGEALAAPEINTKAEAYYLRAKALERQNLDESLAHYAYCANLLETTILTQYEDPDIALLNLLTRLYIDRAWIYIQERPDWQKAGADLNRTEQIMQEIAPRDRSAWSDFYNARAELSAQKDKPQEALSFRQQAWLAASETKDIEQMVKTAYNLGQDYVWSRQYRPGLNYLRQSHDLAKQAGNVQMQGLSMKGMGNCYFFQGDYDRAISHYREAYDISFTTKNPNWRASICYDLAEAYAEVGNWRLARHFYEEGMAIAHKIGQERYLLGFAEMAQQYPMLTEELHERQDRGVAYVKAQGTLALREYMELTGISRSQAHRDISELVDLGILQRVGKGRGTRYVLAG